MQYTLEKISTVSGCDTLLASAQKKKQNLERKRRTLGESIGTFRARLDQLGKDTVLVQALLIAYTAAYEAMPEGTKDKLSMNVKVKRLELRQARLDKKALTYNTRSLLAKQVKYNVLDNQVAAIDRYITAVQNKKIALSHAAANADDGAAALLAPSARPKSQTEKRAYKMLGRFTGRAVATPALHEAAENSFWSSLTGRQKNNVLFSSEESKVERNLIPMEIVRKPDHTSY